MKKKRDYTLEVIIIIIVIAALCSCKSYAQDEKPNYVFLKFQTGYMYKQAFSGGMELGYRFNDFFVSTSAIIPATRKALAPKIFPVSIGRKIGQFEPFISYSIQTIGAEAEATFKGTPNEFINGWRVGYGLSYYFTNAPAEIKVQRQGKQTIASIGAVVVF